MALTHKKVSIKNLIAKIYQDLGLTEEVDTGSFIEWIAEALNKINAYPQLERCTKEISFKNYKEEIPCDLINLHEISINGFQLNRGVGDILGDSTLRYIEPYAHNEEKLHNISFLFGSIYRYKGNQTFIMENGWFKFSEKEGKIKIVYDRLPVDEEGFPLIPDNESYRDAIFWYCAHKYFYIKSIQDTKYFDFYRDADIKFRYYVKQAGAEAIMPDLFTLENIKRNFIRMVPRVNEYRTSFKNLNK